MEKVEGDLNQVREQLEDVRAVAATLDRDHPLFADGEQCRAEFRELRDRFEASEDALHQHMAKVMSSFEPGLFVGGDDLDLPRDNLDLERWFKQPKGHERRIHGRQHAGIRIVQEGPTILLTLDAHLNRQGPLTGEQLLPYRAANPPPCQHEAIHRRKIMRRARSTKKRQQLLEDLEQRYRDCSQSW